MSNLLNQYSFIIVGVVVVLLASLLAWRILPLKWAFVVIIVSITSLGLFQWTERTEVNTIEDEREWDFLLSSNQPVLLEMYSDL